MLTTRIGPLLSLLAGAVLLGAAPSPRTPAAYVLRCRCASTYPQSDSQVTAGQWRRADAVVLARVVAHDTLPARPHPSSGYPASDSALRAASGPIVVRLAVERRWKGPPVDTLIVATQAASNLDSSCDLRLAVGARYLVFAARGSTYPLAPAYGGLLGTGQCTGTRDAGQVSTATLRALDAAGGRAP